ncbi:MAG TPA: ArdC-like ssDNA-binding domain-containing protein [Blastocatellia bacterium]|nr:ArdC-like ssDNA-binding domain-containing protein [Blastocatellia bacterium]
MNNQTKWTELLNQAVSEPGLILKAYSAFHGYSLGNRIAAMMQCALRGIEPGPINTYPGWQALKRQVKRGEKAIELCMPLTRKITDEATGESAMVATNFVWKPRWFVLGQTEGEPIEPITTPAWSKELALAALGITEQPFTLTDGNVQGYAEGRTVAISPIAAMPHKTLFHEIAHIELGHTAEANFTDAETTPRNLREVEAEGVAMLLCESLQLPGAEFSRGYIQNWLRGDVIPEKSAMKIFGAADRILKAGQDE